MKSDMTIAYLSSDDPKDRKSWSGGYYYMLTALEKQFTTVVPLGPVKLSRMQRVFTFLSKVYNRVFPKARFDIIHSHLRARYYAPIYEAKLREGKYDLIFAPTSSVELALLKTDIPVVYYSDTSVNQIRDYYKMFSNLSAFSSRDAETIQAKSLENSKYVIHASDWATDHVVSHYKVDRSKAFTVPMGANIDSVDDPHMFDHKIETSDTCNLLFLGVDWTRKGGPIAFDTMLELEKQGMNVTLTVCGTIPPAGISHPRLRVIPFLNKNRKEDYSRMLQLLRDTHFLVLPTRAECAGLVFAEASAYGIPSLATETGGVGAMVENGVNGYRLPLEAGGEVYANLIREIFTDKDRYQKLIRSSRAKYENELNWNVWGEKVRAIITSDKAQSR